MFRGGLTLREKPGASTVAFAEPASTSTLNTRVVFGRCVTSGIPKAVSLNELARVRNPFRAAVSSELYKAEVVRQDIVRAVRSIDVMHEGGLPMVIGTFCHCITP